MQLIDSHLHIWSLDETAYPVGAAGPGSQAWDASIETLLGYLDRAGVERVVAITPRRYVLDQSYLLDSTRRFPDRVIPVPRAHADDPQTVAQLRGLAVGQGVRGIRLVWSQNPSNDWPADPAVDPIWRACAELGITIGFLTNPDQLPFIGEGARRHPEATVVIDHWGGVGAKDGPGFARFAATEALASVPNIYLKATCFRRMSQQGFPFADVHPLLRRALDAFGRERVMWGTDFGGGCKGGEEYGEEVAAVTEHLDWLSAEDKEWLLRRTALAAWASSGS